MSNGDEYCLVRVETFEVGYFDGVSEDGLMIFNVVNIFEDQEEAQSYVDRHREDEREYEIEKREAWCFTDEAPQQVSGEYYLSLEEAVDTLLIHLNRYRH